MHTTENLILFDIDGTLQVIDNLADIYGVLGHDRRSIWH